jgi:hypothetical protein
LAGLKRAQHTKDVGLELSAVVSQLESIKVSNDTKAGVGEYHVEPREGAHGIGDRPLQIAIARYVADRNDRPHGADAHHLISERREQLGAASGERKLRAGGAELPELRPMPDDAPVIRTDLPRKKLLWFINCDAA